MIAVVIVAIVLAFGGWTGAVWHYASTEAVASYQDKIAKADTTIKDQADQIIAQGKQGIEDQRKAYEDGQAHGKVVIQTVTARGAANVARYPVFQNPQCTLPAESLALLNAARGSLRSGVLPDLPSEPVAPPVAVLPPTPPKPGGSPAHASTRPKPKPVTK